MPSDSDAGGVPRFVAAALAPTVESARNFGAVARSMTSATITTRSSAIDRPVICFVRARVVLELGCGKGVTRGSRRMGRAVVAVDEQAADVAYRHTRDLPNVHVIRPISTGCR